MRRLSHADEPYHHQPTVMEQLEGLALFHVPAGSQPVATSEDAADAVVQSGRKQRMMAKCFLRLAKGPITADAMLWEFQQEPGHEYMTANSVASRLTDLKNQGLAEQDDAERVATRQGGTAFRDRITVKGLQVLREVEAGRQTLGGSFGPETEITAP